MVQKLGLVNSTGYYYNHFRDYYQNIGRYLEVDPLGLGAGTNVYAYAGSNPATRVDPYGLVDLPFYISNSMAVNFVRTNAQTFGIDVSSYSDQQILDFIKFVPDSAAQKLQDLDSERPGNNNVVMDPELVAKNQQLSREERDLISAELQAFKQQCQTPR